MELRLVKGRRKIIAPGSTAKMYDAGMAQFQWIPYEKLQYRREYYSEWEDVPVIIGPDIDVYSDYRRY